MNYNILSARDIESLESNVKRYLASGWKLHGSPFVFGREMCQAMILP